jgi:hypothetical protein
MFCAELQESPVPGIPAGITFISGSVITFTRPAFSDVGLCIGVLPGAAHHPDTKRWIAGSAKCLAAETDHNVFVDSLFGERIINPRGIIARSVPDDVCRFTQRCTTGFIASDL